MLTDQKKTKLNSDINLYQIDQLQNTIAVLNDDTNIDTIFLEAYNDTEIEKVCNDDEVRDTTEFMLTPKPALQKALYDLCGSITSDLYKFHRSSLHSNDLRSHGGATVFKSS